MADDDVPEPLDEPRDVGVSGTLRRAARDDWRAALALAERAEQQRELERLRRLTTDART
jgi:hypothetical protein